MPKRLFAGTLSLLFFAQIAVAEPNETGKGIYKTEILLKDIDGKDIQLSSFRGKALMIVNTASKCGATPQYKELETLYKKYEDRGFVILAFPCNQFGSQEPGNDEQIKQFCVSNYSVSFPIFSKIDVNGPNASPLYRYLTKESPFRGDITWNFTKFIVDPEGNVTARFPTKLKPLSPEVTEKIEAVLPVK